MQLDLYISRVDYKAAKRMQYYVIFLDTNNTSGQIQHKWTKMCYCR